MATADLNMQYVDLQYQKLKYQYLNMQISYIIYFISSYQYTSNIIHQI